MLFAYVISYIIFFRSRIYITKYIVNRNYVDILIGQYYAVKNDVIILYNWLIASVEVLGMYTRIYIIRLIRC